MNNDEFKRRYGPWALVAGASEGMGAEFARQLASRGLNVICVARRHEALEGVAAELRAAYGVEVRTAALDLGSATLEHALDELIAELEIGLLIYNAAYSPIGRFLEVSLAEKLKMLDVNCRGPLVLSHALLGPMVQRGRGGIVLVTSMSGLHGSAMVATYAATKAFDLVLAQGLWSELRTSGVDVLACCAGATATPNYARSSPLKTTQAPMDPKDVVAETLDKIKSGPTLFPGLTNGVAAQLMTRFLPRTTAIKLVSRATRDMYEQKT